MGVDKDKILSTAYRRPSKSNSADWSWVTSWSLIQDYIMLYRGQKCIGVNFCEKIGVVSTNRSSSGAWGSRWSSWSRLSLQTSQHICLFNHNSINLQFLEGAPRYTFSPLGPADPSGPTGPGAPCLLEDKADFSSVIFYSNYHRLWTLCLQHVATGLNFTQNAYSQLFQQRRRERWAHWTYSCAVISRCTLWPFLTDCALLEKKNQINLLWAKHCRVCFWWKNITSLQVVHASGGNFGNDNQKRWTHSVAFRPWRSWDTSLSGHSLEAWRATITKCTRGAGASLCWTLTWSAGCLWFMYLSLVDPLIYVFCDVHFNIFPLVLFYSTFQTFETGRQWILE